MNAALLRALPLAASLLAAPVGAVTIDLSATGSWTGQPGYFETTQTFLLPTNATNVSLSITNFFADDRGILQLNGNAVDATGIYAPGNGSAVFNFGQNAAAVPYVFAAQGLRAVTVSSGFVIGGSNSFRFLGNDTNNGVYGNVLTTAALSSYSYSASVSYDLGATGAVPEPATWAMLILGFGIVGAAMRRRRAMSPA